MIEHDATPVAVKGDDLGHTLWQGRQWAVTRDGVESRDGRYCITQGRLFERRMDAEGHYDWPLHMAEKTGWIDYPDFLTAYLLAFVLLDIHHDHDLLMKSIAEGQALHARYS